MNFDLTLSVVHSVSVALSLSDDVEKIFVSDFAYHDPSRGYEINIDPQFGMDDIRYFPRVLGHSEVCKLALHRVNSRCPQYFLL